jgi:hypothetical protein
MEIKLKALKEEREKERLNLVKSLEEKRFYQSADELRKNESEAFAMECYLEQENQMLDKLKQREIEKKEEEVYVKLNQYENFKKIEKKDNNFKKRKSKKRRPTNLEIGRENRMKMNLKKQLKINNYK